MFISKAFQQTQNVLKNNGITSQQYQIGETQEELDVDFAGHAMIFVEHCHLVATL